MEVSFLPLLVPCIRLSRCGAAARLLLVLSLFLRGVAQPILLLPAAPIARFYGAGSVAEPSLLRTATEWAWQEHVFQRAFLRDLRWIFVLLKTFLREAPDRIVTLGGECSVSVVPFTYLWKKYRGDVAVVWIDTHPDITLPGDAYNGYHAMAVTACMGLGDRRIVSQLPAQIDLARILLVGLRDWERDEIRERQRQYGIEYLAPEDVRTDSCRVLEWLERCGASKVAVHFDMDVLDPAKS